MIPETAAIVYDLESVTSHYRHLSLIWCQTNATCNVSAVKHRCPSM